MKIKTIKKEEIKNRMDRKLNVFLLDVRDTTDYLKEHIMGAKHLPIQEMNKNIMNHLFKEDDFIVTYSEDIHCPAKNIAAAELMGYGFKNVYAYPGSWKEWKESGYPTVS